MKKTITILIILLIPLLLTACTKKNATQTSPTGSSSGKKEESGSSGKTTGSLFDLVKAGVPQHCSGSFTTEGNEEEDVMGSTFEMDVYTTGKKTYTKQKITSEGLDEPMESFMIMDGEWLYSWGNLTGMATKTKMESFEKMAEEFSEYSDTNESRKNSMDFQKQMDYNCKPWVPDNSKFTPPAGIDFVDYSEQMETDMENLKEWMESDEVKNMKENNCKNCESLPTQDGIQKCKDSLGC